MVQATINIDGHTNIILDEEEILELEFKPEYIERAKKIIQQKTIDVSSVEKLRDRLGL